MALQQTLLKFIVMALPSIFLVWSALSIPPGQPNVLDATAVSLWGGLQIVFIAVDITMNTEWAQENLWNR